MKSKFNIRVMILICLLLLCVLLPAYAAEEIACEITFADLASGDQVLLYHDASGYLLGKYPSSRAIAPVYGKISDVQGQRSISEIHPDAAVLTVEKTEDGWLLYCPETGYLTPGQKLNRLSYVTEKTETGLWDLAEEGFLRNVNAENKNGKHTIYLQYYNNFTSYEKKDDEFVSSFRFSLFRLNNEYVAAQGGYVLPVFETSDVHGFLVDTSVQPYQYRMANIADRIRDVRTHNGVYNPATALLLDSGDIYQGNAISNFVDGACMSAAYDLMDYDAVSIGNHEFDWNIETTIQSDGTMPDYNVVGLSAVNNIPVLNANILKDGETPDFANEFAILEKTALNEAGEMLDVRIGVIGYAEKYSSSIIRTHFSGLGYSISENPEYINELARMLEKDHGCDATILLVHGGSGEIASALGENTAVDLVLGGHTHQVICGQSIHGLPFAQPNNNAATYAYANLVFDKSNGHAILRGAESIQTVSVNNDVSLLHNTPENSENLDADVLALSEALLDMLDDELSKNIGYITENVLKDKHIKNNPRSCTAGNWVASILARIVDAQIGFINIGGIRAEFILPDGQDSLPINVADIYTLLPFGTGLFGYEITYGELLDTLQFALSDGDGLFSCMWGIDCYYTEDTVNALVLNDEAIYVNGTWLDDWKNRTVRVAVGEYITAAENEKNLFYRPETADRMVASVAVDTEAAVEVLMQEAAENNGQLYVDPHAHLIEAVYTEEGYALAPEPMHQEAAERLQASISERLSSQSF